MTNLPALPSATLGQRAMAEPGANLSAQNRFATMTTEHEKSARLKRYAQLTRAMGDNNMADDLDALIAERAAYHAALTNIAAGLAGSTAWEYARMVLEGHPAKVNEWVSKIAKDAAASAVRAFYAEVCRRAERKMLTSGKLEGMHYTSMVEVLDEMGLAD